MTDLEAEVARLRGWLECIDAICKHCEASKGELWVVYCEDEEDDSVQPAWEASIGRVWAKGATPAQALRRLSEKLKEGKQ